MYFVGLDFGQAADYTAIAILQPVAIPTGLYHPNGKPKTYPECHVRHLDRFELRTPYPDIVDSVTRLVGTLEKMEQSSGVVELGTPGEWTMRVIGSDYCIVADATGVGKPVIDLLRRAQLNTVSVTITGGQKVSQDAGFNVPKRDLITAVQVLLQQGRLKFAEGLPHVSTLIKELVAMQVKISTDAHDSYGVWREGKHDDLALAVAMAAWYCRFTGFDQ